MEVEEARVYSRLDHNDIIQARFLLEPIGFNLRNYVSRRELPRCRLVLHHDHALELMFVVRTVMELTRFCRAEATHKMWESYHSGHAVLLTTYRERAEFIAEQFGARGLTVTVEGE